MKKNKKLYKWNVLWKLFSAGARIIMIIFILCELTARVHLMGGCAKSNARQGKNIYELIWKVRKIFRAFFFRPHSGLLLGCCGSSEEKYPLVMIINKNIKIFSSSNLQSSFITYALAIFSIPESLLVLEFLKPYTSLQDCPKHNKEERKQ